MWCPARHRIHDMRLGQRLAGRSGVDQTQMDVRSMQFDGGQRVGIRRIACLRIKGKAGDFDARWSAQERVRRPGNDRSPNYRLRTNSAQLEPSLSVMVTATILD